MLLFDENENDMIYFIVANVLVLKAMHDRGYDVKDVLYDGITLKDCLKIIFDKVQWKDSTAPKKYEKLLQRYDEDSEEYFYLADFLERDHYVLRLYLNDLKEIWPLLTADQVARLAEIIDRIVINPAEELIDYFPDYGYYNWKWLKKGGVVAGIEVRFYDVPQYQEVPVPSLEVLNFLEFIDVVRSFRRELVECTSPAA